jgi:alpha-L-fucosidase
MNQAAGMTSNAQSRIGGMMGGGGGNTGPQEGQLVHIVPMHHQGLVADVEGFGTQNGSKVHMWSLTGNANQKWRVHRRSNGTVSFHPLNAPHMALDMTGSAAQQCHIWQADDNNPNQSFRLEPNGNGAFKLRSQNGSGPLLDCDLSKNSQPGTKLHTWAQDTNAPNQQWMLRVTQ